MRRMRRRGEERERELFVTHLCFFFIFSFTGLSGLNKFFFNFLLLNFVRDFVPGPARASTTWKKIRHHH